MCNHRLGYLHNHDIHSPVGNQALLSIRHRTRSLHQLRHRSKHHGRRSRHCLHRPKESPGFQKRLPWRNPLIPVHPNRHQYQPPTRFCSCTIQRHPRNSIHHFQSTKRFPCRDISRAHTRQWRSHRRFPRLSSVPQHHST